MPTPLTIDDHATPNWPAMKPPDEMPDTVVSSTLTLYEGKRTVAGALPADTATTRPASREVKRRMRCLLARWQWKAFVRRLFARQGLPTYAGLPRDEPSIPARPAPRRGPSRPSRSF